MLMLCPRCNMVFTKGKHLKFNHQSSWTKMSPIECLPSSINKLVWNRNRCCNIQEFNPNTGEDLLYKYFWCRVSLFSF